MLARAAIAKESPGKKAAPSSPSPKSADYSSVVDEVESDFPAPKYSWSFADIPLHAPDKRSRTGSENQPSPMRMPLLPIQAKLEVGAIDDPLEHEADRVADQVMRMPEPAAAINPSASHPYAKEPAEHPTASDKGALVQLKCSCGGSCDKCKSEESDDEHGKLQRKPETPQISRAASSSVAAGIEAPPIVHEVLRSPGQPLDAATRAFFETKFGQNFRHVRVHADTRAAESSRAIQARAYTVGRHIVFGAEKHSPATPTGRSLLAHELAHVVQQLATADSRSTQPAELGSVGGSLVALVQRQTEASLHVWKLPTTGLYKGRRIQPGWEGLPENLYPDDPFDFFTLDIINMNANQMARLRFDAQTMMNEHSGERRLPHKTEWASSFVTIRASDAGVPTHGEMQAEYKRLRDEVLNQVASIKKPQLKLFLSERIHVALPPLVFVQVLRRTESLPDVGWKFSLQGGTIIRLLLQQAQRP